MFIIRILGLAAMLLAATSLVTPAFACPGGYAPCGDACCPTQ